MRLTFMGSPAFSVPVLNALVQAGHDVACVYAQPPRPAGRGKQVRPTPVHARALELGLPVRTPLHFKAPDDIEGFAALNADIAVVVAYGLILPQTVLDAPRRGCLNIHASLLPRWRGAAPIHRAVLAGDAETGVAIMQMDAGLDTGPVLLERRVAIDGGQTTGALQTRLSTLGAAAMVAALAQLDTLPPQPQSNTGVTYAHKIDKSEARIDWTRPATDVDRQIRGLSPVPGAWCMAAGGRLKLLGSRPAAGHGDPGQVLGGTTVACGDGAIEITALQPAGKPPMAAAAYLNGRALPPFLC